MININQEKNKENHVNSRLEYEYHEVHVLLFHSKGDPIASQTAL